MKRVLLASTVVLAAALAVLIFQRFNGRPPPPPAAPQAEAHAPAPAVDPAKTPPPTHAEAGGPAEPAPAAEAKPAADTVADAKAAETKAADTKAADTKPADAKPAETKPAEKAVAGPKPRTRRGADPVLPDAAASAIFADRPAQAGEGGGHKVPRIPVLRKPAAGVAPPVYASWPSTRAAAPPAAGHPAPARPAPAHPALAAAAVPGSPGQRLPGAISGLLRDAAGGSLNGVPVVAVTAGGDDAFETITDDEGFYLLAGMKAGRYLVFGGLGAPRSPALPARAVEVQEGKVARVDLRESGGGATVRARPLGADGRPLPGQVLLVAGLLPPQATFPALLGSDAIFRPEAGSRDLLRHVPAGVYTMVVLQGPEAAPRLASQPVAVRGDGEQALEARFPAEVAAGPRR